MRFQSSNPPSFWSNNKKTPKAERGNSWNKHISHPFPRNLSGEAAKLQGNPSLFGTETSCAGFSCVRVSQWEQTRHVHGVGGWRDSFFWLMGQWWVEIPPLTSGNLCVFILCHGSHPPQIVPKSSKSLRDLDFCERYEAGPLLKGKQRFSPPRIRKNITSLSFGKIFSRPKKRHRITSKAGGF